MKNKVKLLSICLCTALALVNAAFAANSEKDTVKNIYSRLDSSDVFDLQKADFLNLHVVINPKKYVTDSFIKIEVYDEEGNLLGTDRQWVGGVTKSVDFHYDLPEYTLGKKFNIKLVEGAESISYYGKKIRPGEMLTVRTGQHYDKNDHIVEHTGFTFNAVPLWEKEVIIEFEGEKIQLPKRARILNKNTMVPVRAVADAIGLDVFYDKKYDSIVCSIGEKEAIFNMGTTYATFFGKTAELPHKAMYIYNIAYVPLRSLADAFDAPLIVNDKGEKLEITIGQSKVVKEYIKNLPVNQWDISSRTKYMIWIDKSDFMVRVYKGYKNNWREVYSAMCAIGAPSTPTVTGSFEYIERTYWGYGSYYVAPVMRFYNGYAIHSTLLSYGGGAYDDRVGVKISHGCIRLRKPDINWLANNIPFRTRIYITE